jgi:hypothetical protein
MLRRKGIQRVVGLLSRFAHGDKCCIVRLRNYVVALPCFVTVPGREHASFGTDQNKDGIRDMIPLWPLFQLQIKTSPLEVVKSCVSASLMGFTIYKCS